jgi:hypothetical protein
MEGSTLLLLVFAILGRFGYRKLLCYLCTKHGRRMLHVYNNGVLSLFGHLTEVPARAPSRKAHFTERLCLGEENFPLFILHVNVTGAILPVITFLSPDLAHFIKRSGNQERNLS